MNEAHCTETNEKSILPFLFYELWSILFIIFECVTLISKFLADQKGLKKF